MNYLVLVDQRVDGCALWWREGRCGYTTNIDEAGRYSKEEAEGIARIRGTDHPVSESELANLTIRRVVMVNDGENCAALNVLSAVAVPGESSSHE